MVKGELHCSDCLLYVPDILAGNDLKNKQCKYEKLIKNYFRMY